MGVTVRKKKGKWFVFVSHNGRRKAKSVGTKAAAEKVKSILEAKLALGDVGVFDDTPAAMPSFKGYVERWMKEHVGVECKSSTKRSYEQLLRLHVTPYFGAKLLNQIRRADVKKFIGDLSQSTKVINEETHEVGPRFSRNTLRLIVCSLRAVLSSAVEDGLLESNPAARAGRFAKSDKPRNQASAMTRKEADAFLAAVREICAEWYPFFLTALRAGLRKGELIALQWGDIQFGSGPNDPHRYILVQRNWSCGEFTTPKSKKSRRVDLSRQLREELLRLRQSRGDVAPDDLVFPSQTGTPIKPDNIAVRYMQPALRKAGLRHFRFHDLRHSFGSHLIQDGASLTYVKEQMGHSSIQITVDTYGHLIPGADISWVDRLDSVPKPNATPAQPEAVAEVNDSAQVVEGIWLPPRDSNPDMLIQSQLSCR